MLLVPNDTGAAAVLLKYVKPRFPVIVYEPVPDPFILIPPIIKDQGLPLLGFDGDVGALVGVCDITLADED